MLLYCKSHKRRPVRLGIRPVFLDPQADIPRGWCECCGAEVFHPHQRQCQGCRDTKGENR